MKKRNKMMALLCASVMVLGMTACGATETDDNSKASVEESETNDQSEMQEEAETDNTTEGYTKSMELLFNEADELIEYVPVVLAQSSYAEAMMQVTGYSYTFVPEGENEYTFVIEMECGTPGEDTQMYLHRTFTYTGNMTSEGDVYSLDAAEHALLTQESGGQFAATSGEGGADYWGPNGLSIDETFANEEGYLAVPTGESLLSMFAGCIVTVDGDTVTFAPLEGSENVEDTTEVTE